MISQRSDLEDFVLEHVFIYVNVAKYGTFFFFLTIKMFSGNYKEMLLSH